MRPLAYDREAADRLCAKLGSDLDRLSPEARKLIYSVGGCSPYLSRLMEKAPAFTVDVFSRAPEAVIDEIITSAWRAATMSDVEAQKSALREVKARAALLIALCDIGGVWGTCEVTSYLSDFADAVIGAALRASLARLTDRGFAPTSATTPERDCGLSVIAMGKLGARELNYSSDVDLIVIYDSEWMPVSPDGDPRDIAIRAAKGIVDLLQDQTSDGYVFRTDLRLRPDPGVSAAAVSVRAAEAYYEAHGQNWERAAFIKARTCAGDRKIGDAFLSALRPFVWRKYLDFAAIEDIHSIKRQIHAAKGGGRIEFYGHDLKLGRGGIREIEFFAQTQQLILGGKNPDLRTSSTLDALAALARKGHVTKVDATTLNDAYLYLRQVEHRIQMINDEQTHMIPRTSESVQRLASFLGENSEGAFRVRLNAALKATHHCFSTLFEGEDRLSTEGGNLIFTGVENDPSTLATLEDLGFERKAEICETIRRWHTGAIRATRSPRARELLTKLTPALVAALSRAGDGDAAFYAFDHFLSRLPSGVQIFSLFAHNPQIFDTLIDIITTSPYLGRELSKHTNFIEALVENAWPSAAPDMARSRQVLAAKIAAAGNFEAKLNAARRWGGEQQFQIGAHLAVGRISPEIAADAFTAIADAAIGELLPVAQEEMRKKYGVIDGGLIVLGLGRLGAGEMTARSDIDLIFIYETTEGALSNGPKAIDGVSYYTRLVRRVVTALSATTEEGELYEVDMQLRPSGAAGPAAVSLAAFKRYYENEAWTWEKMALTKARIIAGDSALGVKISSEIETIFKCSIPSDVLARDVAQMRARIAEAKPVENVWDIKLACGGRTDIDFLWQYFWLANSARLGVPPPSAGKAIDCLRESHLLDPQIVVTLLTTLELFENIIQIGRAVQGGVFDPAKAGEALCARMVKVCRVTTIEEAERELMQRQAAIAVLFDKMINARIKSRDGFEQPPGENVDI